LLCAAVVTACHRDAASGKILTDPPRAGSLYSFNDGEGGFRVGKVIAVDEVVFMNLFSERWAKRPGVAEAGKVTKPVALAYSLQTIQGMQPVLLETGKVTPEELEAYEEWKQSKRDVF